MKLFKNPKTRRRNLFIVLMIPFLMAGFFGFLSYNSIMTMINGNKVIYSIDSMDYHLRGNATKLQIDLFKELTNLINAEEQDEVEIAKSVAANFVADFYTWSNKEDTYDVGGLNYVYEPIKYNIYQEAKDSFYKYLSFYIDEYDVTNLLEVESIQTNGSIKYDGYTIDDKTYDAYYAECTWKYKENDVFNEEDYKTHEFFIVYKNDEGRYEIVQAFGD